MLKGLGKAGYHEARMGAIKAIQSDLAQKIAMKIISPLVCDTLDKLGNKVGREELMKQLGAGSATTYQSGTDPYQGGLLSLLALGGLIPSLTKQLGGGGGGDSFIYQSGSNPYQEGGLLPLLVLGGLITGLVKQLGGGRSKKKMSHAHHRFFGHDTHPGSTVSPSRRSQCGSVARNHLGSPSGNGTKQPALSLLSRLALKKQEKKRI